MSVLTEPGPMPLMFPAPSYMYVPLFQGGELFGVGTKFADLSTQAPCRNERSGRVGGGGVHEACHCAPAGSAGAALAGDQRSVNTTVVIRKHRACAWVGGRFTNC